MMNCALGTVSMANHSSLFCPLTLRGGLGRRPPPPTTFPLLNYDVSVLHTDNKRNHGCVVCVFVKMFVCRLSARVVVSLQCCFGSCVGCYDSVIQTETQQRSHVASFRRSDGLREEGQSVSINPLIWDLWRHFLSSVVFTLLFVSRLFRLTALFHFPWCTATVSRMLWMFLLMCCHGDPYQLVQSLVMDAALVSQWLWKV